MQTPFEKTLLTCAACLGSISPDYSQKLVSLMNKGNPKYVLVRNYGFDDREPATLAELGGELRVSRERVEYQRSE